MRLFPHLKKNINDLNLPNMHTFRGGKCRNVLLGVVFEITFMKKDISSKGNKTC